MKETRRNVTKTMKRNKMINILPPKKTKNKKGNNAHKKNNQIVQVRVVPLISLLPYLVWSTQGASSGLLKNVILKCALDDFAAEIAKFIEYVRCRRFSPVCV